MIIKNLKKAADRILLAIMSKEKIILYGDSDLDGVASVIILEESIKNLGGQISTIYFPDREQEGYGLNEKALAFLRNIAPALLITLDCGIGNFKEVKIARELGFEVIIIDHHEVLEKLPEASLIVDPKQKDDDYSFKQLATAGLVFKLSEILLREQLSQELKNSFFELTALATIFDMMPEIEENKILIEKGLSCLEKSWRPGLRVFLEMKNNEYAGIRMLAQKIIAALNVGEPKDHLNEAYLLLTNCSLPEASKLAKELIEKSYQRQIRIKEISEELEKRLSEKNGEPLIFEGDSSWSLILLGSVASRICRKYQKPTFLFKEDKDRNVGAVRTPAGVNSVTALSSCSEFLETYGGHAPASGFTVKKENLEKFKNCLIKYFKTS